MAKVIFTADDYGVNEGIDRGVIDAVNKGYINSVAAFSNHHDALGNVQRLITLTSGKTVEVGCHLTLTSGKPLTNGVRWLLTKKGFFRKYTNHSFPTNGLSFRQKQAVRNELEAQINVFEENGINVLHLSSHHNVLFWFQDYLDILLAISNDKDIPIRCPFVIPRNSDGLYLLSIRLRLTDNLRFGQMRKMKAFARGMDKFMENHEIQPRMPRFADCRAYGPALSVGSDLQDISRLASKKRRIILEELKRIAAYDYTVEFLFHIIEDDYPALAHHKRKMKVKNSNYTGINTEYFEARMAEYNLLKNLKLPKGVSMSSWNEIKPLK